MKMPFAAARSDANGTFRTSRNFRFSVALRNDEWHYVFCFSEWDDADKLRARYDGRWFKGGNGATVDECTAEKTKPIEATVVGWRPGRY